MRIIAGGLVLLASTSAAASSTMCMFDPPPTAPIPTLEFLGYEEIGPILIHGAGGPRSLPHGSWEIVGFDERSERINLTYTNPGDPSLPPSFFLKGQGSHVQLIVGKESHTGEFKCGLW